MAEVDTGSSAFLRRSYALRGAEDAEALYDEWAETYDAETTDAMGYVGPAVAAARLAELVPPDTVVLDAGAGTGLVGVELLGHGFDSIDGVDVSTAMLGKARETRAYRNLEQVDLAGPLPFADDDYGAVICVGTLTEGHVGPSAIGEFVRVTRPGGVLVATVLDAIWDERGYREAVEALDGRGLAILREAELRPYRTLQDVSCRLVVVEAR